SVEVDTHPQPFPNKGREKQAFTLAEVLITLAIIGVVAAMTIPTLVANYQEKAWATAADVFQKKFTVALKSMNAQGTLAGYSTTEDFVAALGDNFKVTRTCLNSELEECFPMNVTWDVLDIESETRVSDPADLSSFSTASDLGKDWGTNIVGVQFANGTSAILAYDPDCVQDPYSNQISGTSCVAMLYDTSGFSKPNSINKDLRSMGATVKGRCAFKAGSTCFQSPTVASDPHVWNACGGSSWAPTTTDPDDLAFMSEYGIKGCIHDDNGPDYWAGAVKSCGGIDKMATSEDLAKLASYLYNTDVGSDESLGGLYGGSVTLDTEKAASLGFTGNSFKIFSGGADVESETSNPLAPYRGFFTRNTEWCDIHLNRYSSDALYICTGN
ncbi:type II secretion system protein, partial [bacterium]|nr:type II secretion system protein [bacterium]